MRSPSFLQAKFYLLMECLVNDPSALLISCPFPGLYYPPNILFYDAIKVLCFIGLKIFSCIIMSLFL